MRISVDAHALGRRLTGNEVYIRNLLREMAGLDEDVEIFAYTCGPGARADIATPAGRISKSPFVRLGVDLAARVRRDRPDVLHVQYTGPLFTAARIVATVHDVSFLEHPGFFSGARAAQLRITVGRTVRRAARVLTPSEFSRRAILRHYALDPEKVAVIPNGVSSFFQPVDRRGAARRVAKRHGIDGPFVLTVGDIQPRKNHAGLVRAFEGAIRAATLPHRLVIAGQDGYRAGEIRAAAAASGAAERIHFTGYVEDAELLDLYNACDLFVFPSFYEGFGLPVLEAMACGRAVACSETTAMREVAGSAAMLFDPHSIAEMAGAMAALLSGPALRERFERRGLERAAAFSWERAARLTVQAYSQAAGCRAAGSRRKIDDADRVLLSAAAG